MEDLKNYDISTPQFTLNGINTYARLVDVYDGDTITCIFNAFQNKFYKFNIRLNGIDTNEIKNTNPDLKKKALEARKFILEKLCACDLEVDCSRHEIQDYLKKNVIIIWLKCYEFDKYGRILGDIFKSKDVSESISNMLLKQNLAYEYYGGTKQKEVI